MTTPSGFKEIGVWKYEFLANTQFLYTAILMFRLCDLVDPLDLILYTSMRKLNLIKNILDIQNICFLHRYSSLIKKLLLKTCNLLYLDVGGNVNIDL